MIFIFQIFAFFPISLVRGCTHSLPHWYTLFNMIHVFVNTHTHTHTLLLIESFFMIRNLSLILFSFLLRYSFEFNSSFHSLSLSSFQTLFLYCIYFTFAHFICTLLHYFLYVPFFILTLFLLYFPPLFIFAHLFSPSNCLSLSVERTLTDF